MGEAGQELIGIEDRAHLAADFGERFERLGVLAFRFEQPRRGDGLRDVRAELPQDPLVALGERAELVAEQVERADHLALVAKRHRKLRLRARHHREVARILVDVIEEDRPLLGDGRADRALPDLQREMLDDLFRVADRIGDAQLFPLLVQQVDGEDREVGEPRNQVRDLLEKIVEIEDRADLTGQLGENREQFCVGRSGVGSVIARSCFHLCLKCTSSPSRRSEPFDLSGDSTP